MQRFLKLLLIPSGIVLMLTLANVDKVDLVFFFLIGLIVGVLLYLLKIDRSNFGGKVEKIIGTLPAVILSVLDAKYFFTRGTDSATLESLLGRFFPAPEIGLIVLCVLVGLAVFPVFAYVAVIAVTWLIRMCKTVNLKKLAGTVKEKVRLRTVAKSTIAIVVNLVVAAGLGTFLLWAVYLLPVDSIDQHVRASAATIQEEGTYPRLYSWCHSQLDNWTDSIMLLEAADATDAPALEKAMFAYRGAIDYRKPTESLVDHYLHGEEFNWTANYARYWHGYLLVLKPLLSFFDYSTIRIINGAVQLIALALVCVLMKRKGLKAYIIPYVLCYLLLMPIVMAKSLQYSSCYYAMTAGVIALLFLKDSTRSRFAYLVFLNIGILTAYTDFLTYPIATFGVPAIVAVALSREEHLEEKLVGIVRNGVSWCLGYGCMWVSKWIIASVATDYNVFTSALNSFTSRTSSSSADGSTQYSAFDCGIMNYARFMKTPFLILVIAFCVYMFVKHMRNRNFSHERVSAIGLPYLIISLAPIVWYTFATNHSYVHFWFTNKACVVTLAALLFGIADLSQNALRKTVSSDEERSV